MTAYYNEIDPFAAEWLENLILVGAIAPGIVDRRSIEDVAPSDLKEFTQCHFFAGIGVWSHSLRAAGWPDDRPVWTGSCPCQPFSQAGQGAGLDDDRHLWPALHHLAILCQPSVIFGEQVSSKDGLAWLDLVHTDMEATGYAFGALDLCAAGVGAPHIRQRTYWLAHANDQQSRERREFAVQRGRTNDAQQARLGVGFDGLGNNNTGLERHDGHGDDGDKSRRVDAEPVGPGRTASGPSELADTRSEGRREVAGSTFGDENTDGPTGRDELESDGDNQSASHGENERLGPTNGFWGLADWLACRDGKWRPVEPGTFPLANGVAQRVGALRGYGNAIVAPLAIEFVKTAKEYLDGL